MNRHPILDVIQRHEFASTLKHFKNYFSVELGSKAIGFGSVAIFTRLMLTDEYGLYSLFTSLIKIVGVLLTLNLHRAIGRHVYEDDIDEATKKKFVFSAMSLSFISLLVLGMVFWLLRHPILDALSLLPAFAAPWLLTSLWSIPHDSFVSVFQARYKSRHIAVANFLKVVCTFTTAILLLLILPNSKHWGPIYANVICGGVFACYYFLKIRPHAIVSHLKKAQFTYIAKYSVPLIPYYLSGLVLAQINKMMVNMYDGLTAVGTYSVAHNISMLLMTFVASINAAWLPKFFAYMNRGDAKKHDADIDRILRLILIAAIFLACFGENLGILLAPDEYHVALGIIPIIVAGYVFFALYTVYARNIGYAKKTYLSSLVIIGGSVVNIALNILLIPRFSYKASAFSTLIAYGFNFIVTYIIVRRIKLHLYKLRRILIASIPFWVVVPILYFIDDIGLSTFGQSTLRIALFICAGLLVVSGRIKSIIGRT